MATNLVEKVIIVVPSSPSDTTIVHSNPSQAPQGSLAAGGKVVGSANSITWKNPS